MDITAKSVGLTRVDWLCANLCGKLVKGRKWALRKKVCRAMKM